MWKGKRNGRGISFLFVVVVLVIVAVCFSSITTGVLGGISVGKKEGADEQGPDPVERALGLAGLKNQWDAITSWLKLKVMDFRANLGEEKSYGRSGSSRPEEVVKEAVKKTAGTGKETVEHAAKSVAEVVDDAVHRAKEKVKKAVSSTKKSASGDHEDL